MRAEDYTVPFLLELLVKVGMLAPERAQAARSQEAVMRARIEKESQSRASMRRVRYNTSPAEVVAAMELVGVDGTVVDEDRVMEAIARHANVPYRKIDPLKLDAKLIDEAMTRPFAQRHVCLPLERKGARLIIAVDNPYDVTLVQTLRDLTQHDISIVVSSKADILKCVTEIYGFRQAVKIADQELTRGPDLGNLEQFVQLKNVDELDTNDQHVVKAVEYIFHYAFDQRASDIHIEPKREQSVIRMRIDGILHDIYTLPRQVHMAVANRIKMLSRMDIAEKRRPQDGRIKTERDGTEVELRVSTLPVAFGEKIVIRVFDPQILLQDLEAMGFFAEDLATWKEFIAKREGLILVTGPTGSGKTTTLYSTLRLLASPRVNVTTIEDPIEMVSESFNQVLVQEKVGITFAAALRTVLRQDPDVVMVGEIRDKETAQMAIQAALTGHLVISTLHTNDAPSTITRLVDLGVEPYKIASTLIGVMAQRLVRMICDHCRKETLLTPEQIATLGIEIPAGTQARLPVQFGAGCVRCRNTGLYRRTGLYEIMPISATLRRMIKDGATAAELKVGAEADGMRSLRQAAIRKMAMGVTSFEEVAHVLGESVD